MLESGTTQCEHVIAHACVCYSGQPCYYAIAGSHGLITGSATAVDNPNHLFKPCFSILSPAPAMLALHARDLFNSVWGRVSSGCAVQQAAVITCSTLLPWGLQTARNQG